MLKIGLIGAGHLGKIHIKCIKEIPNFNLVGFYDNNKEISKTVSDEFNIKAFNNIDELIDAVDVVDIVTPTLFHYEYAVKSLKKFKHIFIEKPLAKTIEEAKSLLSLSKEADVKVQVGHVERYNPAFISVEKNINNPLFIEGHRLALFNPRGTDVSVVLDLMIHDIDIVLSIVKSKVKKIQASGVKIVSDTPDIANARIEFDNGCVANLTASRISLKNMRKLRIFQPKSYISVDFLEKNSEIIKIKTPDENSKENPFAMFIDMGENKEQKIIERINPKVENINSIKAELESFYNSIVNKKETTVSIFDACNALETALSIVEKIEEKINFIEL